MVSHTFPGIAPLVISTRGFDNRLQKFADGKGYTAPLLETSPSLAGKFVALRLTSVSGTGKPIYVTGVFLASSVAQRVDIERPVTPNRAALTTAITPREKLGGQVASVNVASSENDLAANPVVNPHIQIRLLANQPIYLPLGIVMNLGSSVDLAFTSTVTTDLDEAAFEWYEE